MFRALWGPHHPGRFLLKEKSDLVSTPSSSPLATKKRKIVTRDRGLVRSQGKGGGGRGATWPPGIQGLPHSGKLTLSADLKFLPLPGREETGGPGQWERLRLGAKKKQLTLFTCFFPHPLGMCEEGAVGCCLEKQMVQGPKHPAIGRTHSPRGLPTF